MAEPSNTRLAARLRSFADVVDPPARITGDGMTPEDRAALPEIRETPATLGHVLDAHKFMAEHCRKLEARILAFEQRPVLEDAGVWQERALYKPGAVVTYKGSAWVSREANSNARPGKSSCWRLMVKSEQR
jgi:hypothetical protein